MNEDKADERKSIGRRNRFEKKKKKESQRKDSRSSSDKRKRQKKKKSNRRKRRRDDSSCSGSSSDSGSNDERRKSEDRGRSLKETTKTRKVINQKLLQKLAERWEQWSSCLISQITQRLPPINAICFEWNVFTINLLCLPYFLSICSNCIAYFTFHIVNHVTWLLKFSSQRGETLEEREERRAQRRAARIKDQFGYTAEENPFVS